MNLSIGEQYEQVKTLAHKIMILARNTLLVNMRYLDVALARLESVNSLEFKLATDGEKLYYAPLPLLMDYKEERGRPTRDYMHTLLHCIFRHNFCHTLRSTAAWDLACDVAVESVINDLEIPALDCARQSRQAGLIAELKKELKTLTAEKIYRWLLDKGYDDDKLAEMREAFNADTHDLWYRLSDGGGNGGDGDGKGDGKGDGEGDGGNGGNDSNDGGKGLRSTDLEKEWKEISERIQEDMETFAKSRGDQSADFVQNLREVNRERYDYTAFLKRFATMHEAMKINDDEFDYNYYTYGLRLYENMPLVEALEYKDIRQIKELVIAIDTSGSVQGEQVQSFLQKTYNILKNEESFAKRFVLYIIQCDAEIKEASRVTTQEEFDRYIANMQLKGFGGTDFRPVFGYVNWLLEKKEFSNLKGLIYFTDGYGVFPEKKPPYETAFVFVRDGYDIPEVPAWAIKLVLEKETL